MNGLQLITGRTERRGVTFDDWTSLWSSDSLATFMGTFALPSLATATSELADTRFPALVQMLYERNGVVFACEALRLAVFSEARLRWRQVRSTGPGNLFGTPDLAIVEHPWPGGTTGDLLARILLSTDFAGRSYTVRRKDRLEVLRPDWVTVVMGSARDASLTAWDIESQILAFGYQPGGPAGGRDVEYLDASEVAYFTGTTPDPLSPSRGGVPWIYPALRDLTADTAATRFKQAFFDNGATPSLIISIDKSVVPEKWREWVKIFKEKHEGARNAGKTLYLGAGATAQVVGASFADLNFHHLSSVAELRIASAAGVPPVLLGLAGSTSDASGPASNYPAARRRFADGTMRPLWRNLVGSLEAVLPPPGGAELWYDDDIPFLREDVKDATEIDQLQAQTIVALIRDGFNPDDAVAAVTAGDMTRLIGKHNGFISVQQQPVAFPGEKAPMMPGPIPPAVPATTGSASADLPALRDLRCASCGRLAARIGGPAEIKCERCGAMVVAA